MTPKWYLKRLASMGPAEIIGRVEDEAKRRLWRRRPPAPPDPVPVTRLPVIPQYLAEMVSPEASSALLVAADGLLKGQWSIFGRERTDATADLDYSKDFLTGVRIPDGAHSFELSHRNEDTAGNIKFLWEPARHQHLTVLAAAYAMTEDDRYAERVAEELGKYWAANPFLVGIHWTSGIELGLRMISWTWVRRLLDGWSGAEDLFEKNPVFVDQLGRHHQWLAAFPSHGSSANNHLVAELCGQFVGASAFGLFEDSDRWRADAAAELTEELRKQTFADGLNRELASAYHGFVLEMALAAWIEAVLTDHPAAKHFADPVARMLEALQAVVDQNGKPHRQGDSDDAHGLLLDPIGYDHWGSLLATAELLMTPAAWWRRPPNGDVRSAVFAACVSASTTTSDPPIKLDPARPRPSRFGDAGLTILRDHLPETPGAPETRTEPEIWAIIDHGRHGFLATAAHAHADALAVEVRYGGVQVVSDPGTYCYHGEPEWRDHFRSTMAHATLAIDGEDQSEIGGPFLWTRTATTALRASHGIESGRMALCNASHDGYRAKGLVHQRSVELDRGGRTLAIVDTLSLAENAAPGSEKARSVSKSYPLGPTVRVALDEEAGTAELTWPENSNRATVILDRNLSWRVVRGQLRPPAGWYSAAMGSKEPTSVLIGSAPNADVGVEYKTLFTFASRLESEVERR